MSRILFWIGLVALIVFAIRSKIRSAQKRHEEKFRQAQQCAGVNQPPQAEQSVGGAAGFKARTAEKAAADAETMLECAHCGVFFPAGEAVRFDGAIYCSKAHAALPPG